MPEPATPDSTPTPSTRPDTRRRDAIARLLDDFHGAPEPTAERRFARDHDLPRSTLRHWLRRAQAVDAPAQEVAFFESPAGLAFLHRLQVAAHLAFTQQGPCGLRLVGLFLRLCRLDRFVAASYGARQQFGRALEEQVLAYERDQRPRLAGAMPPRPIALAEDETFHPHICLVALEPVSGFLLVEQYAARRDQATWDAAVHQALAGLPVTVAQQVGDEAKGLLAHARQGLGVPHSPDLFHVQHELSRGTAGALAAQTRHAQKDLEGAQGRLEQARAQRDEAAGQPRGPGRPIDHERRVREAEAAVAGRQRGVEDGQQRQEQAREAIRGLGEADHPFDLDSGQAQDAAAVERRLAEQFGRLEALADAAQLSQASRGRLAKARRVVPGLVAAVAFFWARVRSAAQQRYGPDCWAWVEPLVAGMYLGRVAGQARTAQRRGELRALAQRCLAAARSGLSAPAGGWAEAEQLAREWAGWFQRSSSCVEGRNGQLELRHHSLHRLSPRKLGVLTVLHNYWLKRPDGTTAAERFFGAKPEDLFTWLLQRLPLPARPARRRQKAA